MQSYCILKLHYIKTTVLSNNRHPHIFTRKYTFCNCVLILGVARGEPGWLLPPWALCVIYPVVALLLAACPAVVVLYGSFWSRSVVLMLLISAVSAFVTSALLLEPLKVSCYLVFFNLAGNTNNAQ